MAEIRKNFSKDGKLLSYKIVITLGRDKNGKKVYSVKTIKRPEGLTPKREEKEVMRIADAMEHEQKESFALTAMKIRAEKRDEKRNIVFNSFIENYWMPKHVNDGRHTPDTVAFYKHLSDIIKAYFAAKRAELKLSDVDVTDILDFLYYMRNEAKKKDGTMYSETTIQHCFSTLRNILEYAVYINFLSENPCKKIKQSDRPRRAEREIDFLEDVEAIRFLECLGSDKELAYWNKNGGSLIQWKALISMMIITGLRRGELVGLQWKDIDRTNLIITVRRNVTIDSRSENKIHIGETKGRKIRRVPITKSLLVMLDELREERISSFGNVEEENYIFCRQEEQNMPMYPTEPTRMVKKYVRRHNLPNVSPHDLRHTAATLAIQSGANVKEVQKLLGHRDPATTLRFYAGISDKAARETVEGIEEMLGKAKIQ